MNNNVVKRVLTFTLGISAILLISQVIISGFYYFHIRNNSGSEIRIVYPICLDLRPECEFKGGINKGEIFCQNEKMAEIQSTNDSKNINTEWKDFSIPEVKIFRHALARDGKNHEKLFFEDLSSDRKFILQSEDLHGKSFSFLLKPCSNITVFEGIKKVFSE